MVTFSEIGNYGRLGNQLFQFAMLKSISIQQSRHLLLPAQNQHRLDIFNTRYHKVDKNSLTNCFNFSEKQFNYDDDVFKQTNFTNFLGYYQTEKYFKDIDYIIRQEFTLRDERITNYCNDYVDKIRKKYNRPVVSLHIRRGDNVPSEKVWSNNIDGTYFPNKADYHPLLTNEYISKSMKNFDGYSFLVFSDTIKDVEWCKQNIKADYIEFSDGSDINGHNDIIDFTLMSKCDHNIIANSSFSWWAAWLNNNKEKTVIAPKQWFGKAYANHNTSHLIPENWIKI